jgi:hypothetical protein
MDTTQSNTTQSIGLAELLAQLRTEIKQSQENLHQSGEPPTIDWESAEIEISFGITKEADASGHLKLHIFAIQAGGSRKTEEIHRLTLHLKPHDASTGVARVRNKTNLSTPVAVARVSGLPEGQDF